VTRKYVEVDKNRWQFVYQLPPPKRSGLPRPYVISDTMPPTEQVDGIFYESKAAFRAKGKALGLIEVGNEKLAPKRRSTDTRQVKEARRKEIKKAIEKYKAR